MFPTHVANRAWLSYKYTHTRTHTHARAILFNVKRLSRKNNTNCRKARNPNGFTIKINCQLSMDGEKGYFPSNAKHFPRVFWLAYSPLPARHPRTTIEMPNSGKKKRKAKKTSALCSTWIWNILQHGRRHAALIAWGTRGEEEAGGRVWYVCERNSLSYEQYSRTFN